MMGLVVRGCALAVLAAVLGCCSGRPVLSDTLSNELILPPLTSSGSALVLVLIGRNDVPVLSYAGLGKAIQTNLATTVPLAVILRDNVDGVDATIAKVKSLYNASHVVWAAHSMSQGGVLAQTYVSERPDGVLGLVLLESFLHRFQRPSVTECLEKASIQPKRSLKYPLGYLQDGVHSCVCDNKVAFPVPVLTIAGELDGVVRIGRFAEAYYTQIHTSSRIQDAFAVVIGLNHAAILNQTLASLPTAITSRDLRTDASLEDLYQNVSQVVGEFVRVQLNRDSRIFQQRLAKYTDAAGEFFAPFLDAFDQEGNWFVFGTDDESGSSKWAANAQQTLASPLPPNTFWNSSRNEFAMLSDELSIPPYYREHHRPQINVTTDASGNSFVTSSTVSQLRFIQLSTVQTMGGLNGYEIIKEEKLNVLTAVNDTGDAYVSALEIATKIASRELVFNHTGHTSSPDLDNNNPCARINQAAYEYGLNVSSVVARSRFQTFGLPMRMLNDTAPKIPAGPFWIWSYLQYAQGADALNLTSYIAFFSLDANPYGAGNHYCKLLSPARVVEWVYTDGLRSRMGLV